jgi:hypothetical protein
MSDENDPRNKGWFGTLNPWFYVFALGWVTVGVLAYLQLINFGVATLIAAVLATLAVTVGRDSPLRKRPDDRDPRSGPRGSGPRRS